MVAVLGGSTNAVMHLIAMAHSVDIEITLDDKKLVTKRLC
jgi:dihydroxy-acid dehydratase